MALDSKSILRFISDKSDRPMRVKELARALDVAESDYPVFRKIIKALLDSGDLVLLKRNRIGPAAQLNVAVGTISINRSGTGFLVREGHEVDLLIPPQGLGTALDGDKVMARLAGSINGRDAATVIKVMERAPRNIVGVFTEGRSFNYVVPDNPRIHRDIYIGPDRTKGARNGEKVVARLLIWDDPYLNPEGEVAELIGFPGDPGVDILTVIKEFGFPEEFPAAVLEEAERAAGQLAANIEGRKDLSSTCIYTIDPLDAKDHDDAVSIERSGSGYHLGVHIADVSAFVTEDSALDKEAFKRGNSVYLPGTVIPMLPEALSSDVCSLRENRKRLAHSVFIEFDDKGKMLSWEFSDTVISSRAKLTYEDVQQFFDHGESTAVDQEVAHSLILARELAQILARRRASEGSLDFDLPEAKIVMNEKGEVLELGNRVRLESHRLVEEFMLAANRAVALELFRASKPCLYRVHDKPDKDKLEAFSLMMQRLGHKFPVSDEMRPIQFAKFLQSVKTEAEADFINELLLRSMKKAVYQSANIGHFGLAFTHYAHFTSPIRRYPDLLVHRLLRRLHSNTFTAAYTKEIKEQIDIVGKHCSDTERFAEAAERQAVKVKQVSFMANHLGEEYDGVISGVMSYGFFVRLNNLGAEGLVRFSTVDDDYYYFDEQNFRVIGRKKGMVYRLGDAIRVGILKVNVVRAEIDLFIPQTKTERKKKLTKPAPFRPGKRVLEKKSGRKKDRSRKRKRK
jgi:ribonuclease R